MMKCNLIYNKPLSICLFTAILLTGSSRCLFAQQGNRDHSNQNAQHKIESLKKAYLSQQLHLSPEESQKFWPIYDQYQKNMRKLIRERRQNRINKNNLKKASDQQIEQYMNKDFHLQQQVLQLREQYREKFRKVIPPHKVMQVYKSEKDFNMKLVRELRRRRNKSSHNQHPNRPQESGPHPFR